MTNHYRLQIFKTSPVLNSRTYLQDWLLCGFYLLVCVEVCIGSVQLSAWPRSAQGTEEDAPL